MRQLYIIKTGSTFPSISQQYGDFEDWIAAQLLNENTGLGTAVPISVINACTACAYPALTNCAGVVISGSHAMVTEQTPWMQNLAQWLLQICTADIPVLGICFGHQLLAHTLGGQVAEHHKGLELGAVPITVQIDVSDDPLWSTLPAEFFAHVVHYQSVHRLPPQASVIASNHHEPHQAFRWRKHVWGVQFHPEFESMHMQAYIEQLAKDSISTSSRAYTLQHTQSMATPHAAQLLSRFMRYARTFEHATPRP